MAALTRQMLRTVTLAALALALQIALAPSDRELENRGQAGSHFGKALDACSSRRPGLLDTDPMRVGFRPRERVVAIGPGQEGLRGWAGGQTTRQGELFHKPGFFREPKGSLFAIGTHKSCEAPMQKSFLFSVLAAASIVAVIPTGTQASSVLSSAGLTGVAAPAVAEARYIVRRTPAVRVYQGRNFRRYYGPGSGTGMGQTYTGPGSGTGLGRSTYTGPGSGTGLGRY